MSARLIIVRHGEAAGNLERYFQGHADGAISPRGEEQLKALSARFEDIPFDAIYSSPLTRAHQTAEACNRFMQLPILLDERLIEINGGVFEGVRWAELPERFPEQARLWDAQPWLFHPENGEAMTEVRQRISQAVCEIAAAHEGKTVVIASHGCTIRNLLCWAKGWPIERLNDVAWCDNTAISVIEIDNGVPTLVSENDNSHIADGLSTFATQTWWRHPAGEMDFNG